MLCDIDANDVKISVVYNKNGDSIMRIVVYVDSKEEAKRIEGKMNNLDEADKKKSEFLNRVKSAKIVKEDSLKLDCCYRESSLRKLMITMFSVLIINALIYFF